MNLNDREQSVTLVIPTVAERVDLFSRTLQYLQRAGVKAPILVSDHSPPECRDVIEKALGNASRFANHAYPSRSFPAFPGALG